MIDITKSVPILNVCINVSYMTDILSCASCKSDINTCNKDNMAELGRQYDREKF